MQKKTEIVFVRSLKEDVESSDFFTRAYAHPELSSDFAFAKLGATSIRNVLRDWITEHGISSLYNFHVTCDSVMHPGLKVNEIEALILGFIEKLSGVKHLLIIDPYFYSSDEAVLRLFENMMQKLSDSIEKVTFFTQPYTKKKDIESHDPSAMHSALKKIIPNIKITDIKTHDFHDRFWVDPDKNKGLVMGTSLNGVTKRIALIDHLSHADAKLIAEMALALT